LIAEVFDMVESTEQAEQEVAGVLLRGLADPLRLRLIAALVDEARTLEELSALLAASIAAVAHHIRKLERAGLVVATRDSMVRYRADLGRLQRAAMQTSVPRRGRANVSEADLDTETREVLCAFFDGSRLLSLPVQQRKKELVLEEILRRLPLRPAYRESELNHLIERTFDDYCSVRREWIDRQYMVRDHGVYRLTDRGLAVRAKS
jgi:hypothetical protein